MKKKQACQMVAGLVSVCAVLSLLSTAKNIMLYLEEGGTFPIGMLMLTLITIVCTVVIWRGVMHMDDD